MRIGDARVLTMELNLGLEHDDVMPASDASPGELHVVAPARYVHASDEAGRTAPWPRVSIRGDLRGQSVAPASFTRPSMRTRLVSSRVVGLPMHDVHASTDRPFGDSPLPDAGERYLSTDLFAREQVV